MTFSAGRVPGKLGQVGHSVLKVAVCVLLELKEMKQTFCCCLSSEPGGRKEWRGNLEENKVTMTLFENLSIHLPWAYK